MKPKLEQWVAVGGGWRSPSRGRSGASFGSIGWLLTGVMAIGGWAHASESMSPLPSASIAPAERVVSPTVAAMLARALAKAELLKAAKESAAHAATQGAHAPDTEEKPANTAIVMAPYYVSESPSQRRLLEAVTRQQNQPKPPAFTFEGGGDLLNFGPATLKIKYDAAHKGFDLLKIKF